MFANVPAPRSLPHAIRGLRGGDWCPQVLMIPQDFLLLLTRPAPSTVRFPACCGQYIYYPASNHTIPVCSFGDTLIDGLRELQWTIIIYQSLRASPPALRRRSPMCIRDNNVTFIESSSLTILGPEIHDLWSRMLGDIKLTPKLDFSLNSSLDRSPVLWSCRAVGGAD